jgi:hypothetical protein
MVRIGQSVRDELGGNRTQAASPRSQRIGSEIHICPLAVVSSAATLIIGCEVWRQWIAVHWEACDQPKERRKEISHQDTKA